MLACWRSGLKLPHTLPTRSQPLPQMTGGQSIVMLRATSFIHSVGPERSPRIRACVRCAMQLPLLQRRHLGEIVKAEHKAIDSSVMTDDAKYVKLLGLAEKRRHFLLRFNKAYDRAVLATQRQEK